MEKEFIFIHFTKVGKQPPLPYLTGITVREHYIDGKVHVSDYTPDGVVYYYYDTDRHVSTAYQLDEQVFRSEFLACRYLMQQGFTNGEAQVYLRKLPRLNAKSK